MDILSLFDRFNDDDKCRKHLERLRWPNGVACIRCGDTAVTRIKGRGQWDCQGCSYHFSVTTGTMMHDSHLPLRKWFAATYLMCESKKGMSMSANQLHRPHALWHR